MNSEIISLTDDAWVVILSNGGTVVGQLDWGSATFVFSTAGVPELTAPGLIVETIKTKDFAFNSIPAGTVLYARATKGEVTLRVVK